MGNSSSPCGANEGNANSVISPQVLSASALEQVGQPGTRIAWSNSFNNEISIVELKTKRKHATFNEAQLRPYGLNT